MLGFLRCELEDENSAIVLAFVILILSFIFGIDNLLYVAIVVFLIYVAFVELEIPKTAKTKRSGRKIKARR